MVRDGKLHRMTFSRSVDDHINALSKEKYEIKRFRLHKGRRLGPDDISESGLYGIVDSRRDFTLRIACDREIALILCDFEWRYLQEVFLTPCT